MPREDRMSVRAKEGGKETKRKEQRKKREKKRKVGTDI